MWFAYQSVSPLYDSPVERIRKTPRGEELCYIPVWMSSDRLRVSLGWMAVGISVLMICLWAFWGTAEAFHEGWYYRSLWANVRLTLVEYLRPSLLLLLPALIALRWRRLALPVFLTLAIAAALYHRRGAGVVLIALPLTVLGTLFQFGQPEPKRWAWRILLILPIGTAVCTGIVPGYRAVTRWDDGNYGTRLVDGNGVRLIWAPDGPGWGERHLSWDEAVKTCEHLTADGRALSSTPIGIWRLPTVDEAVRSMVRHGHNAGGSWDRVRRKAEYRELPEKESPLWRRYSQVIYWWTATQDGRGGAYRIDYNGRVDSFDKPGWGDYWTFRCVCSPER
jgi:hypothetical protein